MEENVSVYDGNKVFVDGKQIGHVKKNGEMVTFSNEIIGYYPGKLQKDANIKEEDAGKREVGAQNLWDQISPHEFADDIREERKEFKENLKPLLIGGIVCSVLFVWVMLLISN